MLYKVMLVDDEEYILKDLQKLLDWGALGFQIVQTCNDGRSAVAQVKKCFPHLIISDILMCHVSGLDMLRALRKEDIRTPVVFLSAYEKFSYAREAVSLGASDYLLKPVSKSKLEELLKKIKPVLKENLILQENTSHHIVSQIISEIQGDYTKQYVLKDIAQDYNVSPNYLGQVFRQKTGMGLLDFITKMRMERAKELMRNDSITIQDISEQTGYHDYFHFNKVFKKYQGVTPAQYRRGLYISG